MENGMMPSGEEARFGKNALLVAGAIFLAALIVAGSVVAAAKRPLAPKAVPAQDPRAQAPAPEIAPEDMSATTSLDDDPILGDRKQAKVAIVEFSDYGCPFGQRFHKETFDTLVKDYVDTGKAVIVFRDFPLSFHEPNASLEAGGANCIRKEKGDKGYLAFSQNVFQEMISQGKDFPAGKLDNLIRKAGANPEAINVRAATEEAKAEIAKDVADGSAAGVSGTPSFAIGLLEAARP